MGTVTYLTVEGEILSETRSGVTRDYLPDSLGSTIGLLDGTQTLTDTWTYWPYGEVASRTGTNPTPMQWIGTLGYHSDSSNRAYVRARMPRLDLCRWQTVDPLWPDRPSYSYARTSPLSYADPEGRQEWWAGFCGAPYRIGLGTPVREGRPPCEDVIAECQKDCRYRNPRAYGVVTIGDDGLCQCDCYLNVHTCTLSQIMFCSWACANAPGLRQHGLKGSLKSCTGLFAGNDARNCECASEKREWWWLPWGTATFANGTST